MTSLQDHELSAVARDRGGLTVEVNSNDEAMYTTLWVCEKWDEDKVDFARQRLEALGVKMVQDGYEVKGDGVNGSKIIVPRLIPIEYGIPSEWLRRLGLEPDEIEEIAGNLLLNEGIGRLWDLGIAAGGTAWNNANAFIGVGDSNTAEAATQTELQATQNAANRFYKGMVATWPQRTNQTMDWRSDFTSSEANFAWQEWTVSAGATTASGAGFLVGTTNLNRKVQSLGTKATGTWTMTASITLS